MKYIDRDGNVFEGEANLEIIRHTTSHIMAQAVKRLFKDVKLAIGPAIEDGFYYDFDSPNSFTEEDIPKIEKEMKKIISHAEPLERKVISKAEAESLFKNEPYKLELLSELADGEEISAYTLGDNFIDLCRGPHVENTSKLQNWGYKISRVNGAYWKGSEKNKMLQRIYAYAFPTKEELNDYIHM